MSEETFDKSQDFASMGLRDSVLKGVTEAGFENPSDIQAALIPMVLAGKDVMGQAKTGTGKTAAFGLPILHLADPEISQQALILVPTRELAAQVASELDALGKYTPIRTTTIIGGESMRHQSKSLEKGGHIMVGTPGRIMDMHARKQISFDHLKFVVLDEVDRMLDIGFREDIRQILGGIYCDHQTIFVSATIEDEIEKLARRFMSKDAEKIQTAGDVLTVALVDQKYYSVEPWDKQAMLLHLIRHEELDTTVVFCRTKATVHRLTTYLNRKKIEAREIHGDMPQKKRSSVMKSMREKKLNVLVASDLAARGLDIDHITHVINYDLPEDPDVYIHRIGRTARAGRRGAAWSFVTSDQGGLLTDIEKLAGVMIEKSECPEFTPGPIPDDVRETREQATKVQQSLEEATKARYAPPTPAATLANTLSEEQLKAMFPDGNIPQNLPSRNLGARFKRKRR
jgi:ATP-dependent RNA helicase DeaD